MIVNACDPRFNPPIFDGRIIPALDPISGHAQGNVNFAMFNSKAINDQIDAALAETTPERQWAHHADPIARGATGFCGFAAKAGRKRIIATPIDAI